MERVSSEYLNRVIEEMKVVRRDITSSNKVADFRQTYALESYDFDDMILKFVRKLTGKSCSVNEV